MSCDVIYTLIYSSRKDLSYFCFTRGLVTFFLPLFFLRLKRFFQNVPNQGCYIDVMQKVGERSLAMGKEHKKFFVYITTYHITNKRMKNIRIKYTEAVSQWCCYRRMSWIFLQTPFWRTSGGLFLNIVIYLLCI